MILGHGQSVTIWHPPGKPGVRYVWNTLPGRSVWLYTNVTVLVRNLSNPTSANKISSQNSAILVAAALG